MSIDSRTRLFHSASRSQPKRYFLSHILADISLRVLVLRPKEQDFAFICVELFPSAHGFDP